MFNLFKKEKKDIIREADPNKVFQSKAFNKSTGTDENISISEISNSKKADGGVEVIESSELELGERLEKKVVSKKEKPKKIDIEKYQDLEGITVKKLSLGLWLVENRRKMINIFYGFLALIGLITWGWFFYTFGHYLIFGMRFDQENLNKIITGASIDHQLVLNQAPKPLSFGDLNVIKNDQEKYDFMAEISNINEQHWAEFDYYFTAGGNEIGRNHAYIFPKETKYIFSLGNQLGFSPGGSELKIENLNWHRIDKAEYSDWQKFYQDHTNITFTDAEFIPETLSELSEKGSLNLLRFKIHNNTAYSYWDVDLGIRLMNRNTIIGAEKMVVSNLTAGETRSIEMTWPGKLSKVSDIIIYPEVNIVDEDVYIKPER